MSSQTIKLVEMMYYKTKKIELKLTDLHKFLNLSFKIDGVGYTDLLIIFQIVHHKRKLS